MAPCSGTPHAAAWERQSWPASSESVDGALALQRSVGGAGAGAGWLPPRDDVRGACGGCLARATLLGPRRARARAQDLKAAAAAAAAGRGRGGRAAAPPQTPGEAMRGAGAAMLGRQVLRFWPDSGGWWEATVAGWDAAAARHRLVYDAGSLQARPRRVRGGAAVQDACDRWTARCAGSRGADARRFHRGAAPLSSRAPRGQMALRATLPRPRAQESEEWHDLGALGPAELRLHPSYPLPTPPPPPPIPAWVRARVPQGARRGPPSAPACCTSTGRALAAARTGLGASWLWYSGTARAAQRRASARLRDASDMRALRRCGGGAVRSSSACTRASGAALQAGQRAGGAAKRIRGGRGEVWLADRVLWGRPMPAVNKCSLAAGRGRLRAPRPADPACCAPRRRAGCSWRRWRRCRGARRPQTCTRSWTARPRCLRRRPRPPRPRCRSPRALAAPLRPKPRRRRKMPLPAQCQTPRPPHRRPPLPAAPPATAGQRRCPSPPRLRGQSQPLRT